MKYFWKLKNIYASYWFKKEKKKQNLLPGHLMHAKHTKTLFL